MVTGAHGAQIVDLQEARVNRLARSLAPALESGHAIVGTSAVPSVVEWRSAARQASREHGWRVRTGVVPDGTRVWAVRLDRDMTQDRDRLVGCLSYLSALLSQ
jgi:hypothetical protein